MEWSIGEWSQGGNAVWLAAVLTIAVTGCFNVLRRKSPVTHRRGALLADGLKAQRRATRLNRSGTGVLTLAGIAVPAGDETKHFKLVGTTGTGKSTAIGELLGTALARGDRAVFADPDGGYLRRFYDRYRGDIILNPFERHSVKWDWFAEINNTYDVEQLASGLIPSGDDASAREWRGYARTFLTAVARRCHQAGCRDSGELGRVLTGAWR